MSTLCSQHLAKSLHVQRVSLSPILKKINTSVYLHFFRWETKVEKDQEASSKTMDCMEPKFDPKLSSPRVHNLYYSPLIPLPLAKQLESWSCFFWLKIQLSAMTFLLNLYYWMDRNLEEILGLFHLTFRIGIFKILQCYRTKVGSMPQRWAWNVDHESLTLEAVWQSMGNLGTVHSTSACIWDFP